MTASSDASDAVILHLWQATQIVIDLAVSACVALGAGTPQTYADAFRKLGAGGVIEPALVVAHAYDQLDLVRVFGAARSGPADLRAFLGAVSR